MESGLEATLRGQARLSASRQITKTPSRVDVFVIFDPMVGRKVFVAYKGKFWGGA